MAKVYLGVGHGGSDAGAVKYIVEKDVNLQMALACKEYLEANRVQVKISRTTDKDKDLNARINECNAYDPDLAVDVHNNAGGGDGFEVFHTIHGGIGKTLAQNIEKEVKAIGQNSRGCKTKKRSDGTDYYGFIKWIKAPSIICEGVFVDNKADATQADTLKEQKAFGVAYAKGILKTLGITSNNEPKQEKESNYTTFVKEVQKACGANVDGIAGPETLSKTVTISKSKNSKHKVVKAIQKYLISLGYTMPKYGADGCLGNETTTAIKKYQKDNGCVADGEITAKCKTWKKLLKLA